MDHVEQTPWSPYAIHVPLQSRFMDASWLNIVFEIPTESCSFVHEILYALGVCSCFAQGPYTTAAMDLPPPQPRAKSERRALRSASRSRAYTASPARSCSVDWRRRSRSPSFVRCVGGVEEVQKGGAKGVQKGKGQQNENNFNFPGKSGTLL